MRASSCSDAASQGVDALNWIVDVPALEARLAEAVRYQPLIELAEAPVAAPLTVVCEGRASRTRAELLAATGSRYAPASPCDGLKMIEDAPGPCVFIGKPCDVEGLRLSQAARPTLSVGPAKPGPPPAT